MMDDYRTNKTFKILSIDGGGIKGLYSAVILRNLELKFGKINEHFDMICGTSIGGLIALALSIGVDTKKIVEFFKSDGNKIFTGNNLIMGWILIIKQFFFRTKYSDRALKLALEQLLGDKIMNDSKCCLCIPSVNLRTMEGLIFKTEHNDEWFRDGKLLMRDVAMATASTPGYFPIAKIKNVSSTLTDGGLWANNPTFIGAIEAASYFVGPDKEFKSISILSLSNLPVYKGWNPDKHRKSPLIKWARHIMDIIISTQSKAMGNLMKIASEKKLFSIDIYLRVGHPELTSKQIDSLSLDSAGEENMQLIEDLAQKTSEDLLLLEKVGRFFKSKTHGWSFPLTATNKD